MIDYPARVPERYSANQHLHEARGGLARPGDVDPFIAVAGAGDLGRCHFLSLAIDVLHKQGVPGDFAELGVYKGATASLIVSMARRAGRTTYLLDTFEGLPIQDRTGIDGATGEAFADTSVDGVRKLIGGDEGVRFVKGYFPETASQIPAEARFGFVHLDCDLYAPFAAGLEFFWPRLNPGGFLVMHDYSSLYWPGVEKAVDEFFADKPEGIIPVPDLCGTVAVRKSKT